MNHDDKVDKAAILKANGWIIESYGPLKIRFKDDPESCASGLAAEIVGNKIVADHLREESERKLRVASNVAVKNNLKDGWWIRRPDGTGYVECESFEQAMKARNKWFEGFNIPFLVQGGLAEEWQISLNRVSEFYNK